MGVKINVVGGEILALQPKSVRYGGIKLQRNSLMKKMKENETFIDDGIAIEPFNLDKGREEGYFDASGNYVESLNVESLNENEIKDAWLDSVDTEKRFSGKNAMKISNEDEIQDLTSEQLGKMKRRIADVLEPGETDIQVEGLYPKVPGACKRRCVIWHASPLWCCFEDTCCYSTKGKMIEDLVREKIVLMCLEGTRIMMNRAYTKRCHRLHLMQVERAEFLYRSAGPGIFLKCFYVLPSAHCKHHGCNSIILFDQLTEDAMKPMENGDYKGYEKLAQARQGKSFESMQPKPDNILDEDFLPSGSTATAGGHYMHNAHVASSNSYNTATKSDDAFDTFGEDDENIAANLASNGVITTAAVWAIIMIHHLDCIAMHHQDNGTRIMMNWAYTKRCHRLHPMQVERVMVLVIVFFD